MRGRALRTTPFLPLVLLSFVGCNPSERITHEVRLSIPNVTLTNAISMKTQLVRLGDDPFYAENRDDLDAIDEIRLEIAVVANSSSRLKLGVYASKDQETNLLETTKIADFNLLEGSVTQGPTEVRVFNQTALRTLLLGNDFYLYVVGEADRLNVTLGEVDLVVDAKFIQ